MPDAADNPMQPAAPSSCLVCGQTARVCILDGYRNSTPVYRRLCLGCDARLAGFSGFELEKVSRRSRLRFYLLGLGGALAVVGLLADEIVLKPSSGFGFWQQSGVFLGLFCVMIGTLLRVETLALAGLATAALSALADVIGPIGEGGLGWKQRAVILVAMAMIVFAFTIRPGPRTERPTAGKE